MKFLDYQTEKKTLKYRYDLSSLIYKKKTEFKIKSGSLVFSTYTIDCNKEVKSECDRNLGKANSSS